MRYCLLLLILFIGCSKHTDNEFACNTVDITNMYANYVEEWKLQAKKSFDEAELKVFNKTPVPDIIGPNEDPRKCPCRGTGIIVHGDGHETQCPFHSKAGKLKALSNKKDLIIKPLNIMEK